MRIETFLNKFNQFSDAPNAVAKMRELVLHLAMHGRLVSQDSTDETAHVMLKRVTSRAKTRVRGFDKTEDVD